VASSKKFTTGFLKQLKTSGLLSSALIISCDASNSKAQSNLQSLREIKTGYRAEKINSFSTEEYIKKSPYLFTLHFYTLLNMYCLAKQC